VDDEARIEPLVEQRRLDCGEHQRGLVLRLGKRQAQQEIRRGVFSRDGDSERARGDLFPPDLPLRDQQRPAVASERAAGVEQHIVAQAVGVGVIAQLRDVGVAGECRVVQRFNVGQTHRKVEPLQIDSLVHDRVEHEAVVRAWREAQRERHV
jgi:hypothetical protein